MGQKTPNPSNLNVLVATALPMTQQQSVHVNIQPAPKSDRWLWKTNNSAQNPLPPIQLKPPSGNNFSTEISSHFLTRMWISTPGSLSRVQAKMDFSKKSGSDLSDSQSSQTSICLLCFYVCMDKCCNKCKGYVLNFTINIFFLFFKTSDLLKLSES